MKVKLPADYAICPHCGTVLAEVNGLDLKGLIYSRVLCGNQITCPACNEKFTCKSKVLEELPKLPDIVEVTCTNPKCNTYYASVVSDANIIFECTQCGSKLKYPNKPVPADNFEIHNILSDVTLNTQLVSLFGVLAVTRMGLFIFVTDLKPGNDESKLGIDGDALYERIKPYVSTNPSKVKLKPTPILLQIKHKQFGFWRILDKFIDFIRISPLEISRIFNDNQDSRARSKACELMNHGILSTLYGSISLTVRETEIENLVSELKWFVSVSKFYKPEYDALFFDPSVKYLCECGKVFKASASAIGLHTICGNCGRKFLFRHRPKYKLQQELNIGILAPKELTMSAGADTSKKLKFAVCKNCNKWTWIDADNPVDSPTCRFCKSPVKIGGKASKWIEYACPHCSQTIIVPEILGGCEAICKSCGNGSNVPRVSVN